MAQQRKHDDAEVVIPSEEYDRLILIALVANEFVRIYRDRELLQVDQHIEALDTCLLHMGAWLNEHDMIPAYRQYVDEVRQWIQQVEPVKRGKGNKQL